MLITLYEVVMPFKAHCYPYLRMYSICGNFSCITIMLLVSSKCGLVDFVALIPILQILRIKEPSVTELDAVITKIHRSMTKALSRFQSQVSPLFENHKYSEKDKILISFHIHSDYNTWHILSGCKHC